MNIFELFFQIFSEIPFNRTLNLTLDKIEEDYILMHFPMRESLIGNFVHGILHGGVISSALDMAGGAAAMIAYMKKHENTDFENLREKLGKAGTVNLHIDYLRPGKGKLFTTKAWILRLGNKIIVSEMELSNEEKVLIARATGTYLIG